MKDHILSRHCSIAIFGLLTLAIVPAFPQEPVPKEAFANVWGDLAAADAEQAYRAAGRLMLQPEAAVKLLGEHLQPVQAPDLEQIQAWVADLASLNFKVRDKATIALVAQGELAEQPLRKALEGKLELETRRRVQNVLDKLDQPITAPDKLRQVRAVEVLETIGTPQAVALLRQLGKGYAEHRQTRHVQESLHRLKERTPSSEALLAWMKNPPVAKDDPWPFGVRTRLGTTRFRHEGPGRASAFSPDSRLVISHDDKAIYLWNRATGNLERKFALAVNSLAVAPQGTLLAFGVGNRGQPGGIVCFDWQTGKETRRLDLPVDVMPRFLTFSADGDKVLSISSDESLRLWDLKSGMLSTLWKPDGNLQKLQAVSADGAFAITGSRRAYYVLDLKKNQKHALPSIDRDPRHVAFSPDASLVALGSEFDDGLLICETATGKLRWRSGNGIGVMIYSVRFTPDGKTIAASSYRQEIALWDVNTGKYLRSMKGSQDRNLSAISPDGRWLTTTGVALGVWDIETGQPAGAEIGHLTTSEGVRLSKAFDWIATYDHKYVHLWNPLTGEQKRKIDTGGTFIRGIAVSSDGKWIAAANPGPGEGFVKVWDASTGQLRYKFAGHGVREFGRQTELQFSTDDRYLLSWGDDYYLRKWDMKTGRALQEHSTRIPGIDPDDDRFGFRFVLPAWTPRGDRFLMVDQTGDVHNFDVNTGAKGPTVKVRPTDFGPSIYSQTARLIAICGRGFDLAVHDTTTGKLILNVATPARPRALAFAPDERALALALEDRVIVYELASEKIRLTFPARAHALAFASDGRFLTTAMADTTTLVWDLALLAEGRDK